MSNDYSEISDKDKNQTSDNYSQFSDINTITIPKPPTPTTEISLNINDPFDKVIKYNVGNSNEWQNNKVSIKENGTNTNEHVIPNQIQYKISWLGPSGYSPLYDWDDDDGAPEKDLIELFKKIKESGSEQTFKIEYKISHKYSTYESSNNQIFNCKWESNEGTMNDYTNLSMNYKGNKHNYISNNNTINIPENIYQNTNPHALQFQTVNSGYAYTHGKFEYTKDEGTYTEKNIQVKLTNVGVKISSNKIEQHSDNGITYSSANTLRISN